MKKTKYLKKCIEKVEEALLYFNDWINMHPEIKQTPDKITSWTEQLAFDCMFNASMYKPDDINFLLFSGIPAHKELIKNMLGEDRYIEYMSYLMMLIIEKRNN